MAKILIVDDFPEVHLLIQTMLDAEGHEVVAKAFTSNEAVKMFERARPDVVLLDLVLPGESGSVCLQRLRAIDPEVNVIIVTGASPNSNVYQAVMDAGAKLILSKPITPQALKESIAALEPVTARPRSPRTSVR